VQAICRNYAEPSPFVAEWQDGVFRVAPGIVPNPKQAKRGKVSTHAEQIKAMSIQSPDATARDIAAKVGCSLPTAKKYMEKRLPYKDVDLGAEGESTERPVI
jgi:hypothetical protein